MKYLIKNPDASDLDQLKNLWRETFGSETEYINGFFDIFFDYSRCFVAKNGVEVCGMTHFSEGILKRASGDVLKCYYLCGAATKPEHRKKGVMREIIATVENFGKISGAAAVVLVPETQKLFDYYEELGYKTAFYKYEGKVAPIFCSDGKLYDCDKNVFAERRNKYLFQKSAFFEMDERGIDFRYLDVKNDLFYYEDMSESGYLVAVKIKNGITITETDLSNEGTCRAAYFLLKQFPKASFVKSAQNGRRIPYGMIKSLSPNLKEYDIMTENPYIRLMFD